VEPEGDYLEHIDGVEKRIILKWVLKIVLEGMNWINLAQDRKKCWAVLKKEINIWAPQEMCEIYLIAQELVATQQGFCPM
jgi:hypothetical protein